MKYELTKDLETGNAVIDSEHRQLFKAVNDMMDACAAGPGTFCCGRHGKVSAFLCRSAFCS